jgi:hypothetical protein
MRLSRLAATLVALAASSASYADLGPFANDKHAHVAYSALAGLAATALAPSATPATRFALALVPGVLKELNDARNPGPGRTGWCNRDMLANALGAAAGVYVGGLVVRATRDGAAVSYSRSF